MEKNVYDACDFRAHLYDEDMTSPKPKKWSEHEAYAEFNSRLGKLENEATDANEASVRLKVIDEIVFEVLDWEKSEVDVEKYVRETGFADYVFTIGKHVALVLEAKRSSIAFTMPEGLFKPEALTFALLEKKCKDTSLALRQALSYANELGARYVAISNGRQWILSLTHVSAQAVEDRQIIVFDSLASVANNFLRFWQCFSKAAVRENAVQAELLECRKKPAPPKASEAITGYPRPSSRNLYKNEIAYVLDLLWDTLQRAEKTPLFIEHCYVAPQSDTVLLNAATSSIARRREADTSIAKNGVEALTPHGISRSVGYGNEKPFVILGEVGHGKTTFLTRLRMVDAKELLENYIQLEVNFLDRPDSAELVNTFIYKEIEKGLIETGVDPMDFDIVRGALRGDLERFKNSTRCRIYGDDLEAVKREELSYIKEQLEDQHEYYRKLMWHLKLGQRRSLAIFIDNLDRRDLDIQEKAFLKASAIARDWECVVFICLRPGTFYESLRRGLLDSLAPKTYTLGDTDLAVVLKRRFQFAQQIAQGDIQSAVANMALNQKQIGLKLSSVAKIFGCCEFSARKRAGAIEALAALSNGNIRLLLDLAKAVITSGYLDTGKILKTIEKSDKYSIPDFEVNKTLLYGDYDHFSPKSSIFVNLYDIFHADKKEHFARILILEFLSRANQGGRRAWVGENELFQFLESMYFDIATIQRHLQVLVDGECVAEDAHFQEAGEYSGFRITSRGVYTRLHLASEFQYLDGVSIDTPITDPKFRAVITDASNLEERMERTQALILYLQEGLSSLPEGEMREVCASVLSKGAKGIEAVWERAERNSVSS